MLLPQPHNMTSIAVVITNHNYEQYLDEAIHSVVMQSLLPVEVLVVDDASHPTQAREIATKYEAFGVRYANAFLCHPLASRYYGFRHTNSDYVCFLDADDKLSREYLFEAHEIIQEDKVDVVFSDIQYFGLRSNRTHFPANIPARRIALTNFMHVGCVVRRNTVKQANAFDCPTTNDYHEDWMFWRKVLKTGCSFKKQSNPYLARVHTANRSLQLQAVADYRELRGTKYSTITMVATGTPENNWYFEDEHLIYNRAHHCIYLTELYGVDACQIRIYGAKATPPLAYQTPHNGEHRYSLAYYNISKLEHMLNHVAKTTDSDYIFFYNEANPPPPDSITRLMGRLSHNTVLVQDHNYPPYECTLVVGDVFRHYRYGSDPTVLPFDSNEKVILL